MDALLEQIVASPALPRYVDTLQCLVCLTRNNYEPEIVFYGREKSASFQPGQMKMPAPDFVVEVLSPSTERYDRGVKFVDYAAHGVAEYWIVDPVQRSVEQYTLREGAAEYRQAGIWGGQDEIVSAAVPGFRLPAAALFEREANLAALARS